MTVLAFAGVQLIPDGTILIHIALILVMIFILNRTFFQSINKVLEARELQKRTNLTEAEAILLEAKKKREKLEAELLKARMEGYQIIEDVRKQALAEVQSEIQAIKTEITSKVAEEKANIQKEAEKAKKEIKKQAEKLAEKISNRILN